MKEELYKDLLGVKYTPHGRSKEEGFDCYGTAIEVFKRNGKVLKDFITNPEEGCLNAITVENLEELCIIEIEKGNKYHIAVYIGNGLMIHSTEKYGVCIEQVYRYATWVRRYARVC